MDVIILVILATAIFVAADAHGRDLSQSKLARSATGWFFGTLLLWIVFFPMWLAKRGTYPRKNAAAQPASVE